MSNNAAFGFPIYSDISVSNAPALSGGSWSATLPLTNTQDRRLAKVARSTDATAANTKIIWDLQTARSVGLLAVLLPNVTKSSTPTVQWKGGTSSGASDVYNPGALQYWPTGVTAEDVTGADGNTMNVWHVLVPATTQSARYWELDIVDTANAAGYLDVARACICGIFQPTINIADGDGISFESETERLVTEGAAALYNSKPRRRRHTLTLNELTNAEALGSVRDLQFKLGTSGQFFWVPDPSDSTYGYKRNFLAVLQSLNPLTSHALRFGTSIDILEEL